MRVHRVTKIVVAGFAVLGCVEFAHSTTFRLLSLVVRGQTQCPFGASMASDDGVRSVIATKNRIQKAMRLVRTEGTLQLWETPHGPMWIPAISAEWMPLLLAEQEEKIYGRGEREVRKGDIVLDCGAAMGEFTRTALDRGAALVVTIEPDPEKEPCLRRNFQREIAAGRVIVYPKGVWDKEGTLKLSDGTVLEKGQAEGTMVPLTTIDKLVAELHLPRVDFIKMDIEGAEKQALTGGTSTIQQYHPRMSIATEHLPDDAVAIPQLIRTIAPTYKTECGPCEFADNHIRPQVVYFY